VHWAEELAASLEKAGTVLCENTNKAPGPLRDVKKFLWGYEDNPNHDESFRFLIFFINVFIDKVVYNLTGDVPDVENVTEKVQERFFKLVGETFCNISSALREGKEELHDYYIKLGIAYLDAVKAINDATG
jgi:hypothetical protein